MNRNSHATRCDRRTGPGVSLFLGALVALTAGCGGDDPPPGDPMPDAAPAPDPTDALFRPDHVLAVSITLSPADWAALRAQTRTPGEGNPSCTMPDVPSPYTQFAASLTIDGTTVTNVGIRKKGGFGSISAEKPGLRIKVNEFVPGQKIFGASHLTLNNNVQDPSLISQCLGYGLFRAAGVPASRCAFAHVTVNGEDLGVYTNVEPVRKDFLERNFAVANGQLFESGGDFSPGRINSFQPKSDAPDCSGLDPVVQAMNAADADLPARLGAVVNLDQFYRFWAMEVITDHWDGYANNQNNHYLYQDPSANQMHFIPWGIDNLFTGRERTTRPYSVFACGSMAWRLYAAPSTRSSYLAMVRKLLAEVWQEPALLAEIERMRVLIAPRLSGEKLATFNAEVERTRRFVSQRKAKLLAELDAGDPVWPYPANSSCRPLVGTFDVSFATLWASPFGGSGSTSGTVGNVPIDSDTVFSEAKLDGGGRVSMTVAGELPDRRLAVFFLIIHNPSDYRVGTVPIDLSTVAGFMMFYNPATETASGGGLILPGSLTLTNASSTPGGPVSGRLTGSIIEL